MKKILPIIILALAVTLYGCVSPKKVPKDVKILPGEFRLIQVEERGVVYISGAYTLTPYYSPNGKLCIYEDGQLKEID